MTEIRRDIETVGSTSFDLVVVGGGIYGTCMLLEASRRGWKTLLVERNDFGGATSWSSLRILHGGLRYLQNMNLGRFRRSVREQAWWLTHFPDLVEPLPCIMPLYNKGLRHTAVLRWALKLNDWLAKPIRSGTPALQMLGASKILNADETKSLFPAVAKEGLRGSAFWFDVRMKSPQRLLIELLRWAVAAGGQALNYVECSGFEHDGRNIRAVNAHCRLSKRSLQIETAYVVNCAGPWVGEVDGLLMEPRKQALARHTDSALAFNLILDRPPPADCGIAVTPRRRNSETFFLVPHAEKTLVGTCHLRPQEQIEPLDSQVSAFLAQLNLAIPGWNLGPSDVEQVLVGRLPPLAEGSHIPAKSPTITHHATPHGTWNMTSVRGPKYTTARDVARTVLLQIAERRGMDFKAYSQVQRPETIECPDLRVSEYADLAQHLQGWMDRESIVQVEDLVLRRCDLAKDERLAVAAWLAQARDWPPTL